MHRDSHVRIKVGMVAGDTMNFHPYVARVSTWEPGEGGTLSRTVARQWDIAYLVKSGSMMTSNVLYKNNGDHGLVYLQRVTDMEFDMLDAFDVPCMSGSRFMKSHMGISYDYSNDDGMKVYYSSREINDANVRDWDHAVARQLQAESET